MANIGLYLRLFRFDNRYLKIIIILAIVNVHLQDDMRFEETPEQTKKLDDIKWEVANTPSRYMVLPKKKVIPLSLYMYRMRRSSIYNPHFVRLHPMAKHQYWPPPVPTTNTPRRKMRLPFNIVSDNIDPNQNLRRAPINTLNKLVAKPPSRNPITKIINRFVKPIATTAPTLPVCPVKLPFPAGLLKMCQPINTEQPTSPPEPSDSESDSYFKMSVFHVVAYLIALVFFIFPIFLYSGTNILTCFNWLSGPTNHEPEEFELQEIRY